MKKLLKRTPLSNWKKLLICCVSFVVAFFAETAINLACGPEADPYDYYISFFHNNLSTTNNYQPFYFTGYSFLYSEDEPVNEQTINASEWAAYLGKGVKAADVSKAMYTLGHKTDSILNLGYLARNGNLPDSLSGNTFLKALNSHKNALQYYRFAKQVEPLVTIENQWNPAPVDSTALLARGKEALEAGKAEKDAFFKLRYFYQAQRLLRYGGEGEASRTVYAQYIEKHKSLSYIKGLSLALYAGVEPDSIRSAYLFSKVFEQYPEKHVLAYRNYRYNHAPVDKVLGLAANDKEKATIYAIEGFGKPHFDVQYIKEIYGCEPKSPVIGVLIAREINKLEEAFLNNVLEKKNAPIMSPVYSYHDQDSSLTTVKAHMQALNKFCEQLAADRKYPDYGLGSIASAYLAWMQNDTRAGVGYLAKLKDVRLSDKLNSQCQIVNLLLASQGIKQYNEVNEAALLSSLQWLDNKVREEARRDTSAKYPAWSDYGQRPFAASARNFYQAILAPAYFKQDMAGKAAVAMMKGDAVLNDTFYWPGQTKDFLQQHLGSAPVEQLIRWKRVPPSNAYLKLLTKNLERYSDNDLYDLLGTAYMREHNYSKAVAALKKSGKKEPDALWANYAADYEGADPFISSMADFPKVYSTKTSTSYNKLKFAQAMAALQEGMSAHPENPDNYYKYATGLYNTAVHGNSWYLISYSWAARDMGREKEHYYDDDYVQSINAEKYYLKARKLGKSAEYKARCTYMAAKCRQKQIVNPEYDYRLNDEKGYNLMQDKYYTGIRTNPYFAQLKANYAKTAYYKLAVNECSYFRDFLNGNTKPKPSK